MALEKLIIIPAGAGSGKTYTIQTRLADWIDAGEVRPDRIIAVTFTETAAAEMRQRISAQLVKNNKLVEAEKLNQAYISTIHGFGLRLVTEFAFDGGISPSPRLMNEDEQKEIIKKALSFSQRAVCVTSSLGDFGYSYDRSNKRTAEDAFRFTLLKTVDLLRSLGWESNRGSNVEPAQHWLQSNTPGILPNEQTLNNALHSAVTTLLAHYPYSLADEYGSASKAARESFAKDFDALNKASRMENIQSEWGLWKQLQKLRIGGRGVNLPNDYVEMGQVVIDAANQLSHHPGLLKHEFTHIDGLLGTAEEVLERFAQTKHDAGLVDYTDMIAMAAQLLMGVKTAFESLKNRVDCVIIDEFQDTNPLQFSLAWLLTASGIPTLLVGDIKQAIMGFQGADPRLFSELIDKHPDLLDPLTSNWRTQKPLMDFINDVSAGLFPGVYQALNPEVDATDMSPLDIIEFDAKGRQKDDWYAAYMVEHLKSQLNDPLCLVKDRHTKLTRPILPRDIAILAPKHKILATYRDVLASYGIKADIQQDGWYESPVVQLMVALMSYMDNPLDHHAALYISVTEIGVSTLEKALSVFIEQSSISDPVLEQLDQLRDEVSLLSMPDIAGRIISKLDLFNRLLTWEDAEQHRADLLLFQDVAYEFVMTHKETLASAGLYGSGIHTFLAWLKNRSKDSNRRPSSSVVDDNAVVLKTWHASKGLEWPVVFLAGMHKGPTVNLPNMAIGYDSFEDFGNLLEKTRVEYSPDFPDPNLNERFIEPLRVKAEEEARRLLYVAITRAREKLVIEWPSRLKGSQANVPYYWNILVNSANMSLDKNKVDVNGSVHDCYIRKTDGDYPSSYRPGANNVHYQPKNFGLVALKPQTPLTSQTLLFKTPSSSDIEQPDIVEGVTTIEYGQGLMLEEECVATELGTAVHRCVELFLCDDSESIRQYLISSGFEEKLLDDISNQVSQLKQAIENKLGIGKIITEVPVIGRDEKTSIMTGAIDLLVETDEGYWIIDHKSDRQKNLNEGFNTHLSQLLAYQGLLDGINGKKVIGVGINWLRYGTLSYHAL